jgi:hypothetical protein
VLLPDLQHLLGKVGQPLVLAGRDAMQSLHVLWVRIIQESAAHLISVIVVILINVCEDASDWDRGRLRHTGMVRVRARRKWIATTMRSTQMEE